MIDVLKLPEPIDPSKDLFSEFARFSIEYSEFLRSFDAMVVELADLYQPDVEVH